MYAYQQPGDSEPITTLTGNPTLTGTNLRLQSNDFADSSNAFESLPQPWKSNLLQQCSRLLQLQPNWDTYGSPAVNPLTVRYAVETLTGLMQATTPIPQVVPTAAGGIQFEWHLPDAHLELEFNQPGSVAVLYESAEDEWEADLTSDFTELAAVFRELSKHR